jgi:hypothetical protein
MTGRRNLPGKIIDLVRDGVPVADLRAAGSDDRAIDNALVRVAMSAQRHEWTQADWIGLVAERCCSELGNQAARDGKGKPVDLHNRLVRCWNRAEKKLAGLPSPFSRDDVLRRIEIVRQWLRTEPVVLTVEDRLVLAALCDLAEKYRTCQPTAPWRAIEEILKLGPSPIRRTLDRLDRLGIAPRVERGKSGTKNPKAAVFALPVARAAWALRIPLREVLPVDGRTTPVDGVNQDHGRRPIPMDGEEMITVTRTITGTPEQVAKFHELERQALTASGVTVEQESADLPENVVPIRREGEQA